MNPVDRSSSVPVAIIGMGCLFPKAEELRRFWTNIRTGVDAITEVPPTHWNPDDYFDADPKSPDRTYARRGGFLDPVDFPALDFGIAPTNLDATDTTQLLGLMVARAALEDAGYGEGRDFDRDRVSVVLGVTGTLELVIPLGARLGHPIWRRALAASGVAEPVASEVVQRISDSYVGWQENSFPGLLGNVAAGRIANRLDLGGTNCVIDAACASSLGAVHLALLELTSGRCDIALTGGLDTFNDIFMYMCFSKTPALSKTGHARPFDADGDGTTLGEGLGVLALKRLDDARRDGDRIYAVIKGVGSSSDGKGQAVYAPKSAGQAKALRRAYEAAGVSPATVELVEAHGTGTKVGDAVEVAALDEVYRAERPEGTWCALGSVKSQIGHTKAAAGAAGLIKAALALHHKVLPPTIKVEKPLERATEGPFYVNTEPRPWMPRPDHPRRAAVSAFGFGGSNFHCVLEEAEPAAPAAAWDGDVQLVAFSAQTPGEIAARIDSWPAAADWAAVRSAAASARESFRAADPCRLVLVLERPAAGTDGDAWKAKALALIERPASPGLAATPDGMFWAREAAAPGKLAVLFPGQGSQAVGMLRELACVFPEVHRTLAEADAEGPLDGQSLTDWIYPRPSFDDAGRDRAEADLRATERAQPALGAVSLGAYRLLERFGVRPDALAGHSFGELTALCAAGRIDPASFHRLARLRGRLMAGDPGSGDRGGMLAVMAPADAVEARLRDRGIDLILANRNAPTQVVLSGARDQIARAEAAFRERGITTRALDVSAAFHSPFVEAASGPLREALAGVDVAEGTVPVFANTTAAPYPADADAARDAFAAQLARPVRFVEQVEAMAASGVTTFVEVGPGARLAGLVGSIRPDLAGSTLALDGSRGRRSNLVDLARTLGQLAALGHPVQLDRWDEREPGAAPARTKPRGVTFKVSGANFTPKPAPAKPAPVQAAAPPKPAPAPVAAKPVPAPAPARNTAPAPAAPRAASPSDLPPTMSSLPDAADPRPSGRNGTHHGYRNGTTHAAPAVEAPMAPARHQPPAPAAPAAFPPSPALGEALRVAQENLVALQQFGEQTARLHGQFLDGQDRARQTFEQLLAHQQALTLASLGLGVPSIPAPVVAPAPIAALPAAPAAPVARPQAPAQPRATAIPAPAPKPVARPAAPPAARPAPRPVPSPAPVARREPERVAPAPALAPAPVATPAPAAGVDHLARVHEVLAEVVSEKTGYPAEVLEPTMQLDADLGIDSIKRVEILAALQERLPDAPVIGPEHVGTIRTLGQIAEFLAGGMTGSAAPAATPSAPAQVASADTGSRIAKIQEALSEVVSEKTGYPAEVLEPAMQLDADLGIDSIKRVEILAALQERLPDAPVIGPEHVGTIRTLGQIAEFLAGEDASAPLAAPAPVDPQPARASTEVRPASEELIRLVPTPVELGGAEGRPAIRLRAEAPVWIVDGGDGRLGTALAGRWPGAAVMKPGDVAKATAPDRLAGLVVIGGSATDAFRAIRLAGPALRKEGSGHAAVLATVTRMGGRFGLGGIAVGADSAEAGLVGLLKTARREWAEVACKAIDLDAAGRDPADLADALLAEILHEGPAEVGLTRDGATAIDLPAVPVGPGSADPIRAGDLVVVSGGARGVTAEVAVALAHAFRPTLAILGRSPEPEAEPDWLESLGDEPAIKRALHARANGHATPQRLNDEFRKVSANREVLANLERIRAAGATVVYRSVDVRDKAAVAATVSDLVRSHGPVRGLVHGAGVLADRRIEDQTDDQFAQVLGTKVDGLDALLGAAGPDSLRALCLFSSSTARFGRTGQGAYAAANEVLNKRAQAEAQARPGCRVVSVNWGPWAGGMVTPALRPLFESEGIQLIPVDAGARYLVDELRAGPGGPVEVVILGAGSVLPDPVEADSATPAADPAPATNPTLTKVFERPIRLETAPILGAHVMDGRPVVPMSLILEWLTQGALHRHPGLVCHGIDDFRLLKGVIVRPDRPETIRVLAGKPTRRDGLSIVAVELRGILDDGREVLHARGDAVLGERHPARPIPVDEPSLPGDPADRAEIYRDILFHGPALQGIEAVEGCGELGIAARVATAPAPEAWLDQPQRRAWITDPLALDCAFQMMILWSFERTGAGSLPTFVGRYRQFRKAFPADGVRVVARITESSPHRARADIDFLDGDGDPVARIEDYECVIDASLAPAFRRNRVARAESK